MILRHALLRLSEKQFLQLDNILDEKVVQVRVGEEEASLLRPGQFMYWSRHNNNGEVYYKQTVSFFPLDAPISQTQPSLVLLTKHNALVDMVLAQSARLEALLDELAHNGTIRQERYNLIKGDNWENLLKPERMKAIKRQLNKVNDAEEEMKDWGTSE